MRIARILALAFLVVLAGDGAVRAAGFTSIDVTVRAIDPIAIEPGTLVEYRGGLVLSARSGDFGSWSGLDFAKDGTLYAVADDGHWLSLRLVETNGRLTGVDRVRTAPLLDEAGAPITRKEAADAEGLRIVSRNGIDVAEVSFEQTPDVRIFNGPDFATARPQHMAVPREFNRASVNLGLEAIAVAPAGTPLDGSTLVIAEQFLDRSGNHRGYILDGPHPGPFTLRRTDEFDVSDAAFLPDGDLLVLERRFGFISGFAMRIRRIPATSIAAGAILDGWTVLEADGSNGIDNMEGLAIRAAPDGTALLTLISDDNHSFLQRTILLEFALKPVPPLMPRLRPSAVALN